MRTAALTIAAAALAMSSHSFAAEAETQTVQLRVAPEEADTFEGASKLYDRIKTFAHGECDRIDDSSARNPNVNRCMMNLVTQFVEAIDKPLLDEIARNDAEFASRATN